MKNLLLIILSLFIWSCEKDKDEDEDTYDAACEFWEQEFVSSFPFSDTGSTQDLDADFYNSFEEIIENWDEYFEYYSDYYEEYYGQEWDIDPPTGADYAYHFTLDSSYNDVTIDLCGSYEKYGYDTYLYLFEFDADSCDYINFISENDDYYWEYEGEACSNFNELDSYLNINLGVGDYYAVVGGYSGFEGQYDISMHAITDSTETDSTETFSLVNSNIQRLRVKNNKFKEALKTLNIK